MLRTFQALQNYNFRLFFFGQMISLFGTWMQLTGQAWLVVQLTSSPQALGTVIALQTLPILLFALFGGVFADRVPKRKLLVLTQSLSALQALILAILVSTGAVRLWQIYVLALSLGIINAFDNPTRQAFVVELVGREHLANAVALNSSLFNAARMIGPAIGGVTIAVVGTAGVFYANAISFVPVVGALLAMRPEQFFGSARSAAGNVLEQVGEGLNYVRSTWTVAIVILLMAILGTFGYNFQVTLPLIAEFVFDANAVKFGGLTAFMGLGSLIGALAMAYRARTSYPLLLAGSALFSLLLLAVAASHAYWLTSLLLVLLGVASIVYTASANTLLQLKSPDHLRGRVLSIYYLVFAGTTPIGSFITGWLASHVGVPETLAIEALVCCAGVLAGVRYYSLHKSEAAPARPRIGESGS